MRFNHKQIKGLGRIKPCERPMTVGPISADGKLHVNLGRNSRTYQEMLRMYLDDYDRIAEQKRSMSLTTARLLYRSSRNGKDVWLSPAVADGLLAAAENYVKNGFGSPSERPYRFYRMMMRIHDELKPIGMDRRQLRIYLINGGKRLSVISHRFPGTPVLFNLRRTVKIYNRFHADRYPLNRHYLVMTLPLGKQPVPSKDYKSVQYYHFYDENGKLHRATLLAAVNNVLFQMDRTTATNVIKAVKRKAYESEPKSGRISRPTARKLVMQKTVDAYRITDELIDKAKHDKDW